MQELKAITELTIALKAVPGIGNRSAERIAYEFLKMNPEKIQSLTQALKAVKEDVSICPVCGSYIENGVCQICSDETRDRSTIIVVSAYKDALALERISSCHALFHILNGNISPTKGIGAGDIHLNQLLKRLENPEIKEVILATNPTVDGETTALYISRLLENYPRIRVTRLAYGLPMGANLDYTDDLTLTRALEGRTDFRKR